MDHKGQKFLSLYTPHPHEGDSRKCGFINWNSGPAVLWVDESFEKGKLMANLWKSVVAGPSTEIHSKHSHINRPSCLKKGGLLIWWKWSICEGLMLHTVWWQNEELCQKSLVLIEGRSRGVMMDNEFLTQCAGFFSLVFLAQKLKHITSSSKLLELVRICLIRSYMLQCFF